MSTAVSFTSGPAAAPSSELKVQFTQAAAAQVKVIMASDTMEGDCLRVYVTGGGCSGFQYGFKLDSAQPDDAQVETDGVKLVVDPKSLPYINGATVDYVVSLQGAQFQINNPNAATTCGCGSSFSV